MVSIVFDDIIFSLQRFGGASVYWKNLTTRVDKDSRFSTRHLVSSKRSRLIPTFSHANLFHSSHFRHCLSRGTQVVSTVHDLTYELGKAGNDFRAKLNIFERKQSYFLADALICISQSTKADLLQVYPALKGRVPIYVIHHGFNPLKRKQHESSSLGKEIGEYVLFVGARSGYKNFSGALEGFLQSEMWRSGYKLVCTGSHFNERERLEILNYGLGSHVVAIGRLEEDQLISLYENAHCLLYPSTYEGFGLPLLEAMSLKCPVIACRVSCIPEIAENAALLVAPGKTEEIATGLKSLEISEVREDYIRRGLERVRHFSWDKSAEQHMKAYLEIAKG